MRMIAPSVAAALSIAIVVSAQSDRVAAPVVLDNPQVRAFAAGGTVPLGIDRQPGVVVQIDDVHGKPAGTATWAEDPDVVVRAAMPARTIVVEPKRFAETRLPAGAAKPGEGSFTGMSFKTIFENDRVAALRARMEVGAREAFHTHESDTVVVHLSGGSIEDTADGVTKVNRWKKGDVEFEGRGSSHSARNVGGAVDVVLVTLKPQAR